MDNLRRITIIDDQMKNESNPAVLIELQEQRWQVMLSIFDAVKDSLRDFDDEAWKRAWQNWKNPTAPSPLVSPQPHAEPA